MAELHEDICRKVRAEFVGKGFKEAKSPMPSYRPDFFGKKQGKAARREDQIVIEVEIRSTLFSHHTQDQLLQMESYLRSKRSKHLKSQGLLAVPAEAEIAVQAEMLLDSILSPGHGVKIREVKT